MKKYLIQIIVLILAVLLFSQFDILEYFSSIGNLNLDIWLFLIILQLISFILLLVQWKRISRVLGREVSYKEMVFINMRGVFYETITPGLKVGGEVAKGMTLVNEMGFSPAQASALVVIQKSISIFALVLLSSLSFFFIGMEIELTGSALILINMIMMIILLLLMVILFLPEKLYIHFSKIKSQSKVKLKAKDFLEKYIEALDQIKKNKREILFQFVLSLMIWILFPLKLYFIINALELELSFIRVFAVTIVSYIAGMVPLLPGGLGSFEGTMIACFVLWGINKELGLVIATLFRFTTFWLIFFVSVIYLSIKKVLHRMKGA